MKGKVVNVKKGTIEEVDDGLPMPITPPPEPMYGIDLAALATFDPPPGTGIPERLDYLENFLKKLVVKT